MFVYELHSNCVDPVVFSFEVSIASSRRRFGEPVVSGVTEFSEREDRPACARFTHGSVGAATTSFGFLHVIFSIGRPVSLFAELTFK
jgi:hypothetical protein